MESVEPLVVSPLTEQGLTVFKLLDSSQYPVYWQRQLPPNASYTVMKSGTTISHLILPLPFDAVRQIVCLHEYGHTKAKVFLPYPFADQDLKKPKNANHKVRMKMLHQETFAWDCFLAASKSRGFKFKPEDLEKPVIDWGFRNYVKKHSMPDKYYRLMIQQTLKKLDELSPGFIQLPATQKLLSDVSS